jgi:restriction system protein
MAVPDFQSFFKPLLDFAADGKEHSIQEARDTIAAKLCLPAEDMNELLPSGTQTKFDNRVAWAKSYFIQARVLEAPRRAHFKITQRGIELHEKNLPRIDVKILNQYPEFVEFHKAKGSKEEEPAPQNETPEELLQQAYESIRSDLAGQILDKIKSNSPRFFERLVVDLMVAMGYGGSRADAGQSIGGLVLMSCISRQRDGKAASVDLRSRSSWGRCTANVPRKAFSSRRASFPMTPRNMSRASIRR